MVIYKVFLFLYVCFGIIGFLYGFDSEIESAPYLIMTAWLLLSPPMAILSLVLPYFGLRSWWFIVGFLGGLFGSVILAFLFMLVAAFKP